MTDRYYKFFSVHTLFVLHTSYIKTTVIVWIRYDRRLSRGWSFEPSVGCWFFCAQRFYQCEKRVSVSRCLDYEPRT